MNGLRRTNVVAFPTFDRFVSQVLTDPFFAEARGNACGGLAEGTLPLDVSEDDRNFYVRANLPGFRKQDVSVDVHEGVLSIQAEHVEVAEQTTEQYHRRERRTGSLTRRIKLPTGVQEQGTQAQLENGVLTLTLPKTPKDEPRKIEIK